MTEFDIEVECPACGALFQAPRIRAGSAETCPVCRFKVLVPGEAIVESSAEAPQAQQRPVAAAPAQAPPVGARAPTGRCSVCLSSEERFNIVQIGPIVDELDGLITLESRRQIAKGRGVLAQGIPAGPAHTLAARLTAAGLPAFVVDEGLVPDVEGELPFVCLRSVTPDAIRIQSDPTGTERDIPARLVVAGYCAKQSVVSGGPTELKRDTIIGFGGAARTKYSAKRREAPRGMEVTLLVSGRSGKIYSMRFGLRQVAHSYAHDGPRSGAAQTLQRALADIIRCCPQAFFPESTREVAAGRLMAAARVKDRRDAQLSQRWVLCCVARQWHGDLTAQ